MTKENNNPGLLKGLTETYCLFSDGEVHAVNADDELFNDDDVYWVISNERTDLSETNEGDEPICDKNPGSVKGLTETYCSFYDGEIYELNVDDELLSLDESYWVIFNEGTDLSYTNLEDELICDKNAVCVSDNDETNVSETNEEDSASESDISESDYEQDEYDESVITNKEETNLLSSVPQQKVTQDNCSEPKGIVFSSSFHRLYRPYNIPGH